MNMNRKPKTYREAYIELRRKYDKLCEKKREFSKILAKWAVVMATAAAVVPFVLSALDKQPVSELATVVFSTCVAYLITYAAKSAVEKTSRNKHGLDENGVPYDKKAREKEKD